MKFIEIPCIEKVEYPITRDDKYFYQIIKRLDKIIELQCEINTNSTPNFTKPIGTKDEPNEDVTVEYIHYGNVDEKLGEDDDEFVNYEYMTVKELKQIAKDKNISGYSTMRKNELIDSLIRGD